MIAYPAVVVVVLFVKELLSLSQTVFGIEISEKFIEIEIELIENAFFHTGVSRGTPAGKEVFSNGSLLTFPLSWART